MLSARHAAARAETRAFLETKTKHYMVMGLVALDVLAILADVFIALMACDMRLEDEKEGTWVGVTRGALHVTAAVLSGVFLVELGVMIWLGGLGEFFEEWFYCFDAFVIVTSFVIDVVAHGTLEEIGSLIIVLRLWRVVKIVDELGVSAEERTQEMDRKLAVLERRVVKLEKR
ncbi:hypothetical protein B0T16DRAFT_356452, partial [Cercophora newfieldiana]